MKQRRRGMLIAFTLLAGLLVVLYFFGREGKHYQWYESYRSNSEQPYGTAFVQKMLESWRPGEAFELSAKPLRILLGEIEDGEQESVDYVFIGQDIFLDAESRDALASFIEAGGDAFIASLTPPEELLDAVYIRECDSAVVLKEYHTDSVTLNFFHPTLRQEPGVNYAYWFMSRARSYSWNYFDENVFCASAGGIVPLGHQDEDRVNFVKIPVGRGNLYLHSNPLVFTNYFMVDENKMKYASAVFSHLKGSRIVWDEYSKVPFAGNNNSYNSPLYYILAQPGLKYAWWLLLLMTLLYAVFAAKRKQRVIPVMEQKTNTSLEFVNMIALLHFKNGNHLDMARKKMKYFLYFVRSRYGIHAEKFREENIKRLAEKARLDVQDVAVIFTQYYLIEDRFQHNIEANRLVNLYDAIDNFYKHCK